MDYNLKDIESANARSLFSVGDTVTIKIYDKDDNDVTPANPDDECTPYGELDTFLWPYSNLVTLPTEFQEYSWVMTNGTNKQRDVDSFASLPDSVLDVPFDVDLSKKSIYKGDSFEPTFRIDSNISDLKVKVWFSDGETSSSTNIYKATANVVDRGDGEAGDDDQVILIAEDISGTFLIYRSFLSGDETAVFEGRFVDMMITVTTPDDKTQTRAYKIGFFTKSAIGFDTNP
jgi:hypothetical protein